jgi:hypothetical protein
MAATPCNICNNLEKRQLREFLNVLQHRVAFDCTIAELQDASQACRYCRILLRGVQRCLSEEKNSLSSISRVYVCGPADDRPRTLSLEIYFEGDRPKLEIEFHSRDEKGMSLPNVALHR